MIMSSSLSSSSRMALVILAMALTSSSPVDAFTVRQATTSSTSAFPTQLGLVPAQGKQLVAAFTAACESEKQQHTTDHALPPSALTEEKSVSLMAKAKQASHFVASRIFSIPGAIMGRHPAAAPALVDLPREQLGHDRSSSKDDVVLYPMVGFQFVKGDGKDATTTTVLPTTSNPACRINHVADQEVYGWYCTACRLDSIYSDTYCEEPKLMIETTPELENDDPTTTVDLTC